MCDKIEYLITQAKKVGNHATKKEALTTALKEYIKNIKQKDIIKLFGTIDFDPDYNYKKQR